MALEKWSVVYQIQDGGMQGAANWKAGDIVVKSGGKTKSQGLVNEANPSRVLEPSPLITNSPVDCKLVTIEAENETEAAEAIRAFYGQNLVNGKMITTLAANLKEQTPQV